MPTLTYYSVSADLTTMVWVLNAVAMICKQTAYIWAFAFLVCMYRLFNTTVAAGVMNPLGKSGPILAQGTMSAFIPFVLAMCLTNPGLQGTVQVESTINGAVEEVSNVPIVISFIPAGASVLSMSVNEYVETAFQNANADYATISATQNGFINPMKALLSARTAMVRLNGIDSEVSGLLSNCLGPDSGVNYDQIEALVMNAGNTGATASTSIAINGINPTALGALLYQASLNTNGIDSDPNFGTGGQVDSCPDAANQVATDITNALTSAEFPRAVLGAVNGMDDPIVGADYSFSTMATQYNALATANTLGTIFSGGTAQANAEFMNLLFAEMVQNDLGCIKASGADKVQCEASMLQESAIETNNLQEASSEVPMLQYAGSFANKLIALIIGLGPVIVMFMMAAGVNAGKTLVTVAHIVVWPLLVLNVGAEIVNGMLAVSIADFWASIRQGGYISQASSFAAYKELSLQVGTGSHIMASLPVLMTMIFSLGESAALVSVASSIAPKSNDVAENLAPKPASTHAMFENGSVGSSVQLAGGGANMTLSGALPAATTSTRFGEEAREASNSLTNATQLSRSLTEGHQTMMDLRAAASSNNYSRLGWDTQTGEAVNEEYQKLARDASTSHSGSNVSGLRGNANSTGAGVEGSFSGGIGGGGGGGGEGGGIFGFKAGIGATGSTSTSATDNLQSSRDAGTNKTDEDASLWSKAVSNVMNSTQSSGHGSERRAELAKTLGTLENYQDAKSKVDSSTDATTAALRQGSSFVASAQAIGANEIALQQQANPEFAMFQAVDGHAFETRPGAQKYLNTARSDAARGATSRVVGNEDAQAAVARHTAAVQMFNDQGASVEDRAAAMQYLADEASAMQHLKFQTGDVSMKNLQLDSPQDRTGVNDAALSTAVGSRVGPVPGVGGGSVRSTTQSATLSSDGDAAFKADVMGSIQTGRAAVDSDVKRAGNIAQSAGLGPDGPGTVRRTADNVADNVEDTVRAAGSPSNTGLGNLSNPPAPAPAPKPPQPQKDDSPTPPMMPM